MKHDLYIQEGIVIPDHELDITTSRAGGPGGQHVNKTSTRITVRWNVRTSQAVDEAQKERISQKLQSRLTADGDLIIHNSSSRSQDHNKRAALKQLVETIRKALHVPKKRIATKVSEVIKETRVKEKRHRGIIKSFRRKNIFED